MSTGESPRAVRFKYDVLNVQLPDEAHERPAPTSANKSIWQIPGIDRTTFYAAALYLHVAVGQLQVRRLGNEPKTPKATRDFLDRLADCFARSKLQDARDHVSATAMVRDNRESKITIYIAKNQSENKYQAFDSKQKRSAIENENETFAQYLVAWFTRLAHRDIEQTSQDSTGSSWEVFKTMCEFSRSRLEHYIGKLSNGCEIDHLSWLIHGDLKVKSHDDWNSTWEKIKSLIRKCQQYQENKAELPDDGDRRTTLLADLARCAGQIRKEENFRDLTTEVESLVSEKAMKHRNLAKAVIWINYLGRHFAAYVSFITFCTDKQQGGHTFHYCLLPSQEDEWTGNTYIQKIESWGGELGLTKTPSLLARMGELVKTTGNKARVHCEMQLLMHFSKPNSEDCLDYFGCSKKSCWLCWQMIVASSKYGMKDSHRKLYPRWAFPFEFTQCQSYVMEGLRTAYDRMLSLIQDSAIYQIPIEPTDLYRQTSTRMTPHHRGLFSSNLITAQNDMFPFVEVSALHLPAEGLPGTERHVKVCAYKRSEPDHGLMERFFFNSQEIVFAFQLLTHPGCSTRTSEYHHWSCIPFSYIRKRYIMVSRSIDVLDPNPTVLSLWDKTHDEKFETFSFRGDVFIFQAKRGTEWRVTLLESFEADYSECLKGLEDYFRDTASNNTLQNKKELDLFSEQCWQTIKERRLKRENESAENEIRKLKSNEDFLEVLKLLDDLEKQAGESKIQG